MGQLLATIAWWAGVVGTYVIADRKSLNRLGWTALAVFLPLVALAIVALLRPRARVW